MRRSVTGVDGLAMAAVHLEPPAPLEHPAPQVVLVHGMVVAGRGMVPLARVLAGRGLCVHVPDLPGFGRSDATRHARDVDATAASLASWIDRADLAGAAVLGNSFGTQVAAAAVADAGAPVSRLVLLSPTIDPRLTRGWTRLLPAGHGDCAERRRRGPLARVLHDVLVPESGPGAEATLRSLVLREYLAAGPARVVSTYRHALRDDIALRMGRLRVPVLVVRPTEDRFSTASWVRALAASAPEGTYAELHGVDHDGQFTAPADVADAVAGYLAAGTTSSTRTALPGARPAAKASTSPGASDGGSGWRGRVARSVSR